MPNEIIFDIPTNQYEVHKMPIKQYTQEGYKITDCYVTFLGQEYQMDLQSGFNGFEKDLYQPQVRQELTILPNYQLQFNGTGQVTIPHSTTLNPVIPFTIELWVKFNQLIDNTAYWLIGKGTATSGSGGYDFVMDISSGQFRFNLVKYYIIDQRVNISPLEVDTWYHFQAVQRSTSVTYYINGNPFGSYTHSGNYQMYTANAYMGKNRTTALSSNMILDEVRFWNIQKSQQEIQQTMNSHLIGNEQGLQGYWNFNNGSGSTIYDLSLNSNNGTKNDGATWCVSEQPIGNAYQLNFDGSNDYISMSRPGSLTNGLTISAWVFPTQYSSTYRSAIFSNRSDNGLNICLSGATEGVLGYVDVFEGGSGIRGRIKCPLNTWSHVQVTINGSDINIYVNGEFDSNHTYTVTYGNQTAYIGTTTTSLYPFQGIIKDVRIFERILNQTEITNSMYTELVGDETGLVQYYKLNEGAGTTANDQTGNYNGSISGAVWKNLELPIGYEYQLSFDGSDDYVKIENNIIENPTQLTISQWFKKQSGSNYQCVIHKGSDTSIGQSEYWMGIQNSNYLTVTIGQNTGIGWQQGQTNVLCEYNTWYHLCAAWDGSIVKIYVNGEYNMEYELSTYSYISYPTRFGASGDAQGYLFSGTICDVKFYDYQLSEQEIQQTMNIPLTGNEQGLVQYYKLNENEGRIAHDYANNNDGIIVGDPIWVDSDQPLGNLFDYEEIESEDREISFRYIDEQLNEYIYNDTITILNISQRNRYYFLDRLNDLQKTNNINIQHNLR